MPLTAVCISCQQFDFRKAQFSFSAEPFSGICMCAWFTADSGTFNCQAPVFSEDFSCYSWKDNNFICDCQKFALCFKRQIKPTPNILGLWFYFFPRLRFRLTWKLVFNPLGNNLFSIQPFWILFSTQCPGSSGGWWVTYFADPSKVCAGGLCCGRVTLLWLAKFREFGIGDALPYYLLCACSQCQNLWSSGPGLNFCVLLQLESFLHLSAFLSGFCTWKIGSIGATDRRTFRRIRKCFNALCLSHDFFN